MTAELSATPIERPAPVRPAPVLSAPILPAPILDGSPAVTEDAPARARRQKKSWREQRWERRRRRRWAEEVLGWILVPIILIALYWAVKGGLNALGTSPTALYQQLRAVASSKS